ncbi:hypothetical protein Bca4012_050477 [Brassica carinata]
MRHQGLTTLNIRIQVKMFGSINLTRKRPMEDDYGQTPEGGSKKGKDESREWYMAILLE